MTLETPLCRLLDIEYPIVQAPIGTASTPLLASAVSKAGALGSIALSWTAPEAVAEVVRAIRELTDRPFAVNLVLEWPPEERLHAALEAGAPIVSLAWGDPAPWVETIHS